MNSIPFRSFSLKHRNSDFFEFFESKRFAPRKFWLSEWRRSNGFCSNVPWSLYSFERRSRKICYWKVRMWLSWWLILVLDCWDDSPRPKATSRSLPGTVFCVAWQLVDIIVVGCYAYTTQLKIVIFSKKGFFGHCEKAYSAQVFFSSMGSKNTSSSKGKIEVQKRGKIEKWI